MKRKASLPTLKKKRKAPKISTLIEKADKLHSLWVRRRWADHAGYAACVSCGRTFPWQEMDAGHFVPRGAKAIRWDDFNVHPQCKYCNRYRDDASSDYTLWMIDQYGRDKVEELKAHKLRPYKPSRMEMEARIEELAGKLADLAMGLVSEKQGARWALENVS